MLEHVLSEGLAGDAALLESVDGLVKRTGDPCDVSGLVRIALEHLRILLVLDAVHPGGDGGSERVVGIGVGPGYARLDPERLVLTDDPEAAGPVVVAPHDGCRSP